MPVLPVFIFDGKGRPKLKRSKTVRGNAHWIIPDMKAMLDGFGFAWAEVSFGFLNLAILMLAPGSRRS
jgi:Holliday junction resolvase YEN1